MEQIEALGREMRRRFVSRMVRRWRSLAPDATRDRPDEDLAEVIAGGIESAREFGITDQTHVQTFLLYVMEHGPQFGRTPKTQWAGRILGRNSLTASEKLEQVESAYVFERK